MKTISKALLVTVAILLLTNIIQGQVNVTGAHASSNGTYATLYAAFNAINSQSQTGNNILVEITSDITESTNFPTLNQGTWTSLTINPSGNRTISCNRNGSLISMNGADNVTIDGLNDATNNLTIENTNTGSAATALNLYNNTTYFIIRNCTLLASPAYTSGTYDKRGVISFTGNNSNIEISRCNIGKSGSNRPNCGINSTYCYSGTTNVLVDQCNIYDYYAGGSTSTIGAGIQIGMMGADVYNGNWTITNNSFYQTSDLTMNSGKLLGIYIMQGNDYTISGNYFGGTAPNCGGSAMSVDGSGFVLGFMHVDGHTSWGGIPNATGSNVFTSNTISNIDFYSSNSSIPSDYFDGTRFFACSIHSGNWSVTNNTVGSMSSNNNILLEDSNQSIYSVFHIFGSISSTAGPVLSDLSNNNIGGITFNSTNSDFNAIYIWYESTGYKSQVSNISNNIIGSSLANSIYAPNANNSSRYFRAIRCSSSNTTSVTNITSNTIQNVSYNHGNIYAVYSARDFNFSNNTLKSLKTSNGSTAIGVSMSSNDNYATATINSNFLCDIESAGTISGIKATSYYMTVTIKNNVISLGNAVSNSVTIEGIHSYYLANVYFNTIYICGTATSGSNNSYAYYRNSSWTNTTNVRNNIFFNARTNSGASGKNYAAYFGSSSTLTVNYNDYYTTGTGGVLGYYPSSDINSLPNANLGANSINANPSFASEGGNVVTNYVPYASLPGVAGTGVTTDYTGITRAATPTMGAFEAGFSAVWTGSVDNDWNNSANWSPTTVPNAFADITIPNTTNSIIITPEVNASCNNMIIDNGASILIESDATGDGSLIVNGSLSGTGTFNVEQYLTANQWHLVSSPITAGTAGVFQGIWLRPYIESTNTFGEYIVPTETSMPTGQGFSVWAPTAQTRTFSGTINCGNQGPFSASLTGSAGPNTGWNLMGNPYTSAIDWDAASGWTKTNLANSVYIWNGTQYATYVGGVGANGGSRYISKGQGFFVQATSSGASLSMNKNVQVHNSVSFMKNDDDPENTIRISVNSNGYNDEAVIVIRESNTYAFDPQTDAYKFYGSAEAPQLVVKKDDGSELCIASLGSGSDLIDRSVSLYPATDGQHTLTWSHNVNHDIPMLFDNFTQTFIYPDTEYVFVANSSDLAERFVFKENITGVNALMNAINVWESNNILYIQNLTNEQIKDVRIYDLQGQLVLQFCDNDKDLGSLAPAVYFVKATVGDKTVVEKIIVK